MLESIDIRKPVTKHIQGFENPTTGKLRKGDLCLHYGLPLILGALWAVWGPNTAAHGNLVQGLAILTGLFIGLLVYVFQLRLDIDEKVEHQRSTRLIGLIDVLFWNTVYATLVGGLATVAVLVVDLLGGVRGTPMAVVIALGAHLVLTTLLLVRRASTAYSLLVKDKRRALGSR